MSKREEGPPPLGPGGAVWESVGAARERAVFFFQRRAVWPVEDAFDRLGGGRALVGIFGGGGIAIAGIVAALLIAGPGGSDVGAGTTEALAPVDSASAGTGTLAGTAKPKPGAKPAGPTLHGAPPDFAAAKDAKAGVGDGTAVAKEGGTAAGEAPVERGAATSAGGANDSSPTGGANDSSAATAKIGATPEATAAAQADDLATASSIGVGPQAAGAEPSGPPAPKGAKRVARRFAQAFVIYEVGGIDAQVRDAFHRTTTKQLSRSLLQRPPRQPANVEVPRAKVVNVVAGPSEGGVYSVSISLLRVGVTSELRLQLEQGPGKKWQVTNVLG